MKFNNAALLSKSGKLLSRVVDFNGILKIAANSIQKY